MTENLSIDTRRATIKENYLYLNERICEAALASGRNPDDIIFLAASKTVEPEFINYSGELGIKYIGENRVQEFLAKNDRLNPDFHKHFIGHLQTNKVKDIVGKVEMIESVHSLKLAGEISSKSLQRDIVTNILLEVNIGKEENKSGFFAEELEEAVAIISELKGISVKGLMTIPPICQKESEICRYFQKMHQLFIDIGDKKRDNVNMVYLSMGMSGDFSHAIKEGANIIRIGTALYGQR